jgi:hypothetical protein
LIGLLTHLEGLAEFGCAGGSLIRAMLKILKNYCLFSMEQIDVLRVKIFEVIDNSIIIL